MSGYRSKLVGRHKLTLMRELAVGDKTQAELAAIYGVHQTSISDFKIRWSAEIAEIAEDLESEFAGLWIAEKRQRVADLEQIAERMAELAAQDDPNPKFIKLQLDALQRAADELGQLNTRAPARESTDDVVYEIEGVDPTEVV